MINLKIKNFTAKKKKSNITMVFYMRLKIRETMEQSFPKWNNVCSLHY